MYQMKNYLIETGDIAEVGTDYSDYSDYHDGTYVYTQYPSM